MTKPELLEILYSERDRVEKQYTQPGWTRWAIIAAIASLGWMCWNLIDDGVNWLCSLSIFFSVYLGLLLLESVRLIVQRDRYIPMWVRDDIKGKISTISNTLILTGLLLIFILCAVLKIRSVVCWMAIICDAALIAESIWKYSRIYKGYVTQIKIGRELAYIALMLMPIAMLVIILLEIGYSEASYKVGVLLGAMWYLTTLLPFGEGRKLEQIDKLIVKVLNSTKSEIDENPIFKEMELYTIGLKYGRYLSETRLKELDAILKTLLDCIWELIICLECKNGEGADEIIERGTNLYNGISNQIQAVKAEIDSVYRGDIKSDDSLQPIFGSWIISLKLIDFFERIKELKDDKSGNVHEKMAEAAKETIGTPDMLKAFGLYRKNNKKT